MINVINGTLFNGQFKFYLLDGTNLVQEIKNYKEYSPTAIAALGRTTMIASIMGLMLKGNDKLTVSIKGDGEIGEILVTSNAMGEVKGKVLRPEATVPKINDTKLNVGELVGKNGFLRVVKDLGLKEPFISEVPLISGEIAEDFAYYFSASEQIPTAIASGVLIGRDQNIENAGCLIVQAMPEADDENLKKLEEFFSNFTSISNEKCDYTFLKKFFSNEYNILAEKKVKIICECEYNKFLRAIQMLPVSDIIDLKKDKTIECICDFCSKKYEIITEDL